MIVKMPHRVVLWQSFPSLALASVIRELATLTASVTVVCSDSLPAHRRSLGWSEPDYGQARLVILPKASRLAHVLAHAEERGTVHLVGGVQRNPDLSFALRRAAAVSNLVGVVSEPPINQATGWSRVAKGLYLAALPCALRGRIKIADFLLAISRPGDAAFTRLGWPKSVIFPFGYFTDEPPNVRRPLARGSGGPARLVYAGQFAKHKGVLDLVTASELLRERGVHFRLDMYGLGPMRRHLEALVRERKLEGTVVLQPPLAHNDVATALAAADVYVAPGHAEPWGLTVNESIQAGTPVVVSDGVCGGSELVQQGRCGRVYPSGSHQLLANALFDLLKDPAALMAAQAAARSYAPRLSPRAVAVYLLDVIEYVAQQAGPRPLAPWLSGQA